MSTYDTLTDLEGLVHRLSQTPGVISAKIEPQGVGLFLVDVVVADGDVDALWSELVEQVNDFELSLGGDAGLDLAIRQEVA